MPLEEGAGGYCFFVFCLQSINSSNGHTHNTLTHTILSLSHTHTHSYTAIADEFGFDDKQKDLYLGAYISGAFFAVGAPAALLVGYISDRANRKWLLCGLVLLGMVVGEQAHGIPHLPTHGTVLIMYSCSTHSTPQPCRRSTMYSNHCCDVVLALVCASGTHRNLSGWIPAIGILHGG